MESFENGLMIWRPLPGHLPASAWFGLPTRRGGFSTGPYATLNFGLEVGDERDRVLRNRAAVFRTLGIPAEGPLRVRQVHGTRIVRTSDASSEADGFLLESGDPWTAVSAADCAPVAILDRGGSAGALVHSGWRGARDGIAREAVRRLVGAGATASRLVAVIGPCIHVCCYPVGPEVARGFSPETLRPHPAGTALDLPLAIARGLEEAGVPRSAIAVAPECTSCDAEFFFSHRRDRGVTGRHWGLLRLAPL